LTAIIIFCEFYLPIIFLASFYQPTTIGAIQAASSAAPAERSLDIPPLRDRVVLRRAEDDNPIRGRDLRYRIGKVSGKAVMSLITPHDKSGKLDFN